MAWVYTIIGLCLGFSLGLRYAIILNNKKIVIYREGIENMFSLILSNFDKLIFVKRINKYAYFSYESWEIIYQLDNKTIHVFNKEECLATSKQLEGSTIVSTLLSNIDKSWSKDINNTIIIDENEISINYIEEQRKKIQYTDPILTKIEKEKNVNVFTIDDILDKINKVGYNNLTTEEKEFLKNASK